MPKKFEDATSSSSGVKPDSSNSEVNYKTLDDFMEEIIIRQSGKEIPKNTSPTNRQEAIQLILNDPKVRHRFVFNTWPRPPPAPGWINKDTKTLNPRPYACITPENSRPGKMAPNGMQLWGATLFDFFRVLRLPDIDNQSSISTGSKLLRWCKENGEYVGEKAVARHCIKWAERERPPELVPVYDIQILIMNLDELATSGRAPPERDSEAPKAANEGERSKDQPGDNPAYHGSEIEESDARKDKTCNENKGVELNALPVILLNPMTSVKMLIIRSGAPKIGVRQECPSRNLEESTAVQ